MAEIERSHRSSSINSSNNNYATTTSTDFFICFTSCFSSSSSMRLSSKSIPSPARTACLTTSLSRRLRTSGSLQNASSEVFNSPIKSNGRKRSGSGYGNTTNNIEPSSPKVTCIGQVRVKTRNHVKRKMRARSKRKGNTSFGRSAEQNDVGAGCRFTICESLRAFGSELNCFFPCRSSENGHQNRDRNGRPVDETGAKRREIEPVVCEEADVEEDRRRSRRRHAFEELDISAMEMNTENKDNEEVGCISICSPPKNALLLMRCRSDPVKVAALANRVRERQLSLNDGARGGDEEEDDDRRRFELEMEDKKRIELCEKWISGETTIEREIAVLEEEVHVASNSAEVRVEILKDLLVEAEEVAPEIHEVDSFEEEIEATIMKNVVEEGEQITEMEDLAAVAEMEEEVDSKEEVAASVTHNQEPDPSPDVVMSRSQQDETTDKEKMTATPYKVLPDSLLLMMCEPKLSMEVSKETWVCSTDFARCIPSRPPAKKIPEAAGDHHHSKKRIITATDSSRRRSIDKPPLHQALLQPPRSSCSYPAPPPMIAAVGEQKIVGANKAYEPPLLPRCNSEPRKSASKLAPEACFWKNRKLEPHPPATAGVSATAIGF